MAEKKMTKRDVLEYIKGKMAEDKMVVDFCNHELELLANKSSKSRQTKTQQENEVIKTKIVESLMNIAQPVTISDLQAKDETMATYSNQKLSALLSQLVKEEKVVKVTDKKKSYFSVEG